MLEEPNEKSLLTMVQHLRNGGLEENGHARKKVIFGKWLPVFLTLIGFGVLLVVNESKEEFIVYKDGEAALAPWRQEELERDLDALENAEQYALKVGVPGYYPCYNCLGEAKIFLNLNEIWKYGVTTRRKEGRYPNGLPHPGLLYIPEFEGTLQECLRQEKIKIFNYAILPENLKRPRPLKRPPGNKVDR